MKRFYLIALVLVLLGQAGAGMAQAQQAAGASLAREEALRIFDDAANKMLRLAEAIPAEKYTWRPGEGVRSVSEVFLHVAAGDYSISRRLGANPPEGLDLRGLEKSTTEKAKIIETLKQAVEHTRAAFNKVGDADLDKTMQAGQRQVTMRETMYAIATHNHEHLGQMIAYTRMNGITPPWTEEAQQRQQQQPAKRP